MSDLIRYGFSLGRAHVLEESLLSENQIERLLETANLREIVQILEETIYGEFIDTITSENDIENSLGNYVSALSKLLEELGGEIIRRYFKLSYDLDNIKAFYQKRLALAKKISIPLALQLAQTEIDLANIRTWWRSSKQISEEFIEGGKITRSNFLSADAAKQIAAHYQPLEKLMDEGATLLDKDLDNCILLILRKQKYEPISADRLIAFLKAKEIEIKNVRLILFGGLNNFSSEITTDNLRYSYA